MFESKFEASLDSVCKTVQEQGQRHDELLKRHVSDHERMMELMTEKHALELKQVEETWKLKLKEMEHQIAQQTAKHASEKQQWEDNAKLQLKEKELKITQQTAHQIALKDEKLQSFLKANTDFACENRFLRDKAKEEDAKLKESERQNRVLRSKLEDRGASSKLSRTKTCLVDTACRKLSSSTSSTRRP